MGDARPKRRRGTVKRHPELVQGGKDALYSGGVELFVGARLRVAAVGVFGPQAVCGVARGAGGGSGGALEAAGWDGDTYEA